MGVNIKGLDAVSKKLKKIERLDIPLNRATRRMANGLKTDASNAIRENINWKKTYVDEGLKSSVRLATATNQESSVTVSAQRRGALLRNFRHSVSKKNGVKIEVTKGKPATIKRGFKIRLKNGVETIAWRRKLGGGRMDLALHGPSPSQILDTKQDQVKEAGTERFAKELNHEIKRHLDGK